MVCSFGCGSARFGTRFGSDQFRDEPQDVGEETFGNGDFGHLKRDIAAMAHELRADLDKLFLQARQRPVIDRSDEIDQILIGSEENAEVGDLEPSAGASSVFRISDLFRLGTHRLICGNATDPRIVLRLMQSNVARLIFTDEPFNVAMGMSISSPPVSFGFTISPLCFSTSLRPSSRAISNLVFGSR
jgi:hypothetical protein